MQQQYERNKYLQQMQHEHKAIELIRAIQNKMGTCSVVHIEPEYSSRLLSNMHADHNHPFTSGYNVQGVKSSLSANILVSNGYIANPVMGPTATAAIQRTGRFKPNATNSWNMKDDITPDESLSPSLSPVRTSTPTMIKQTKDGKYNMVHATTSATMNTVSHSIGKNWSTDPVNRTIHHVVTRILYNGLKSNTRSLWSMIQSPVDLLSDSVSLFMAAGFELVVSGTGLDILLVDIISSQVVVHLDIVYLVASMLVLNNRSNTKNMSKQQQEPQGDDGMIDTEEEEEEEEEEYTEGEEQDDEEEEEDNYTATDGNVTTRTNMGVISTPLTIREIRSRRQLEDQLSHVYGDQPTRHTTEYKTVPDHQSSHSSYLKSRIMSDSGSGSDSVCWTGSACSGSGTHSATKLSPTHLRTVSSTYVLKHSANSKASGPVVAVPGSISNESNVSIARSRSRSISPSPSVNRSTSVPCSRTPGNNHHHTPLVRGNTQQQQHISELEDIIYMIMLLRNSTELANSVIRISAPSTATVNVSTDITLSVSIQTTGKGWITVILPFSHMVDLSNISMSTLPTPYTNMTNTGRLWELITIRTNICKYDSTLSSMRFPYKEVDIIPTIIKANWLHNPDNRDLPFDGLHDLPDVEWVNKIYHYVSSVNDVVQLVKITTDSWLHLPRKLIGPYTDIANMIHTQSNGIYAVVTIPLDNIQPKDRLNMSTNTDVYTVAICRYDNIQGRHKLTECQTNNMRISHKRVMKLIETINIDTGDDDLDSVVIQNSSHIAVTMISK